MKKTVLFLFCILAGMADMIAGEPEWIRMRPVKEGKYVGIGMAPVSDADFQNKAATNALLDIASQIRVGIESTSFMQTVDVDGRSKEFFEEKVKSSVASNLQGHELKDTYKSSTFYYVYYELDKKKYEKFVDEQTRKGTDIGLDYYLKGRQLEESHSYADAMKLYARGLEAIEPYMYLDLVTVLDGSRFDVAAELYDSFVGVFSGFRLVQNVTEIGVEAFKPSGEALAVCLSRNGEVVPNMEMTASFASGDGALTPDVKTDATGTAVFYVTNVTSRQPVQNVDVSIDKDFIDELPETYRDMVDTSSWPQATFTLVLVNKDYTAYFMTESSDLKDCERQVRGMLANNNVVLTEDTSAQLFITLSTTMEVGGVVQGELYDMNECFCSLELKIHNNHEQTQLLDFSVSDVRVLVPADRSEAQTKAACTRELMKRVNARLPKELKKLNVNF